MHRSGWGKVDEAEELFNIYYLHVCGLTLGLTRQEGEEGGQEAAAGGGGGSPPKVMHRSGGGVCEAELRPPTGTAATPLPPIYGTCAYAVGGGGGGRQKVMHRSPSNLPRGFQRFGFVNPFRAGGFSYLG